MSDQKAPPLIHRSTPGSRLDQLHAQYLVARAKADEATKLADSLRDAIKAELLATAPEGTTRVELHEPAGVMPALRLSYVEQWRVDAKRMKAEDPVGYARYAAMSGRWEIRKVTRGG